MMRKRGVATIQDEDTEVLSGTLDPLAQAMNRKLIQYQKSGNASSVAGSRCSSSSTSGTLSETEYCVCIENFGNLINKL